MVLFVHCTLKHNEKTRLRHVQSWCALRVVLIFAVRYCGNFNSYYHARRPGRTGLQFDCSTIAPGQGPRDWKTKSAPVALMRFIALKSFNLLINLLRGHAVPVVDDQNDRNVVYARYCDIDVCTCTAVTDRVIDDVSQQDPEICL